MGVIEFRKHIAAMDQIEAMNHLKELKASEYPHLNSDAHDKYHSNIRKKAFPSQRASSFDEIDKIFGAIHGR